MWRSRVLGRPSVRAACGGSLSLTWLPLRVICRTRMIACCQSYTSYIDYELCERLTP